MKELIISSSIDSVDSSAYNLHSYSTLVLGCLERGITSSKFTTRSQYRLTRKEPRQGKDHRGIGEICRASYVLS